MRFSIDHTRAVGLALLLFGLYLLTASGHPYAIDELQMYGLTEAVGTRGTLALNSPGADEPPIYSTYGPGQSLAALPLYWVGNLLTQVLPTAAHPWARGAMTLWFNPGVTALVAALLYLGARHIASPRAALFAALTYALGGMAWPHAKTFFAEPLNALLWFGAFLLVWRPTGTLASVRAYALAGLLAGLAPAVKIQAGIVLPILGLYALWAARQAPWRRLLAWGGSALLPLLALAGYNTILFGSPLRTGYGASIFTAFTTPFWEGFSGQLWGLHRGLIWCSPLLLLAPLGLLALWRRDRGAALLCGAMALSQVLFYATWFAWDGGGAWGPRFLNTVLPFLCLPLAALAPTTARQRVWLKIASVGLAVLTVPVQLGALSINLNQCLREAQASSQILAHLGLAYERMGRAYAWEWATGRVVLARGFAPSEGSGDALLPRWTLPEARIVVRPTKGSAKLTVAASSCYVATGPTALTVRVGEAVVANGPACPGRVYRLLLPPGPAEVRLTAPVWRPAAAGLDRAGELGVYLSAVTAEADGQALRLVGDRLPADPAPLATAALRRHLGDPRVALWDFWWAYLPLMPLPAWAAWLIGATWSGVAVGSVVAGGVLLRRDA